MKYDIVVDEISITIMKYDIILNSRLVKYRRKILSTSHIV